MTFNTKLLVASAVSLLGTGVMIASASAAAATTKTSPLANKIASTFHLNAIDVQNVINSERQSKKANRPQRLKIKLDSLVSSGKITQDQENAILTEAKTLAIQFKQDKNADRAQLKDQLQQWLNQNDYNVDLNSLQNSTSNT